jgi:hypothetical protein
MLYLDIEQRRTKMAELQKLKVEEITTKTKKDGNPFWLVKSGNTTYMCFDSKIKEMLGKEVEVYVTSKETENYDGTRGMAHYINLPKPKANYAKQQQANPDAMILSYAKDIVVAKMQCSTETKTIEQLGSEVKVLYEMFKKLLEPKEEKKEE